MNHESGDIPRMLFASHRWPPYDPAPRPLLAVDARQCRGWPPAGSPDDVLAALQRHGFAALVAEPWYFPPLDQWRLRLDTATRFSVQDPDRAPVLSGPLTIEQLSWVEAVVEHKMCIIAVLRDLDSAEDGITHLWDAARRGAVVAGLVGLDHDGDLQTPTWWPEMVTWFKRLSLRGV